MAFVTHNIAVDVKILFGERYLDLAQSTKTTNLLHVHVHVHVATPLINSIGFFWNKILSKLANVSETELCVS